MILVIGANSFLANRLIHKLLQCNKSSIKILLEPSDILDSAIADNDQIIKELCSLEDFSSVCSAMNNVKIVYNLYSYNKAVVKKHDIYRSIGKVANVINAALLLGIERIIHVSAMAAISNVQHVNKIDVSLIHAYPSKNNIYGIYHYEINREVFRGLYEGLNTKIIYTPLFLEEGNKISQLINYYSPNIKEETTIVSLSKINNFINTLCKLKDDNIDKPCIIESENNISIKDLKSNLSYNAKISRRNVNLFSAIKYFYFKNNITLNSEVLFWRHNTSYYISS